MSIHTEPAARPRYNGGQPIAPSVRGQMAIYLAGADPRCAGIDHGTISNNGTCPVCHLSLADYVRALDVVVWP